MPSTPGLCQLSGTRTLDSPPPASSPQGPGDGARRCGESGGGGGRVPLGSGGCALQVGGLCGVPGRGTQESGEGPGAAWEGESRPESSTFSGDEDEKGEGLEVNPRLLEPRGANRQRLATPTRSPCLSSFRPHPRGGKVGSHSWLSTFLMPSPLLPTHCYPTLAKTSPSVVPPTRKRPSAIAPPTY